MKNFLIPFLCGLTALLMFDSCGQAGYHKGGNTTATLTDATANNQAARIFSDSDSMLEVATDEQVDALYTQLQSGQTVTLDPKVYYLDIPLLLEGVNDLTLDGNGATLMMRDKNEDVLRIASSSNIVLKNFKATHVEPEGPIGCRGNVVQVYDSSNIMVENCRLNGSGIIGVLAYAVENLQVHHNYIYNNSRYGVVFDAETSIELTYNRFEDNGPTGNLHLVQALDIYLDQVEQISKDQNSTGLIMSRNKFQ